MRKSGREVLKIFGGNRDNAANSGSRASNWNNVFWNSNWNIGLRAACDDRTLKQLRGGCYGVHRGPSLIGGQHISAGFGKHTTRFGERGVSRAEIRADIFMGQRYKNLFDSVISKDNLWLAYQKASKGKRNTAGYLQFHANEGANILALHKALKNGTYRPGKPRLFVVHEPKPREISALPFVDRIAQHALCNVIEPIFDKVFLPQSYACRTGKGTHSAAVAVQAMLRKTPGAWILKTDFSKYFASINREVLHKEIRRKISCTETLELIEKFIPRSGVGLPIGNLTSQLAANIYGHMLDRWLLHKVGIKQFARYMDDVVVIGRSKEAMRLLQVHMESFARVSMGLRFSHWSVQSVGQGVNFCGYRIWPAYKLLRKRSVAGAKRKIARYTKANDKEKLDKFLAAWRGHAQWANAHNLLTRIGVRQ